MNRETGLKCSYIIEETCQKTAFAQLEQGLFLWILWI